MTRPMPASMRSIMARLEPLSAASAVPGWAGVDTDVLRVTAMLDAAEGLRGAVVRAADTPDRLMSLRGSLRRLVTEGSDLLGADGAIGRAAASFLDAHERLEAALESFQAVASSPSGLDGDDLPAAARSAAAGIASHASQLNGWTAWRRARQGALDLDLGSLVEAVERGSVRPGAAAEAFELAHARWWADGVMDA